MKTKLTQLLCGWLALAGALGTATANAAVRVYGIASSSGEQVTVQAYADISTVPIISFTLKLFYDPSVLQVVSATRNDVLWQLSDGSISIPYAAPDAAQPGEVSFLGACMDAANPMTGVMGNGVLLGTVVFSRRDVQTPEFAVSIGRPGDFASFVTVNGVTLESLPGEVQFGNVVATREDQDLDGLNDEWETEHFKSTKLAFYSDDGDGDGVNNQGEEALGSDPNDGRSNLQLSIRGNGGRVLLQWTSFEGRTYAVEAGTDLGAFQVIESGLKATPPMNALEVELPKEAMPMFFRIRLESDTSGR